MIILITSPRRRAQGRCFGRNPAARTLLETLLTTQFEGLALLWLLDPGTIDRAHVQEQGLRATFEGLKAWLNSR